MLGRPKDLTPIRGEAARHILSEIRRIEERKARGEKPVIEVPEYNVIHNF